MKGFLKNDLLAKFPPAMQQSSDVEIRAFADFLNAMRDELVTASPHDGEGAIEDIEYFFDPVRVQEFLLPRLAAQFAVSLDPDMTEREQRKAIQIGVRIHKQHSTIHSVEEQIETILGANVTITAYSIYTAFDEQDVISGTSNFPAVWGENVGASTLPPITWRETFARISYINIGDISGYTQAQLDAVYAVIAKDKPTATLVVVVDNTFTPLKYIYSTDLSMTSWPANVDPEP